MDSFFFKKKKTVFYIKLQRGKTTLGKFCLLVLKGVYVKLIVTTECK